MYVNKGSRNKVHVTSLYLFVEIRLLEKMQGSNMYLTYFLVLPSLLQPLILCNCFLVIHNRGEEDYTLCSSNQSFGGLCPKLGSFVGLHLFCLRRMCWKHSNFCVFQCIRVILTCIRRLLECPALENSLAVHAIASGSDAQMHIHQSVILYQQQSS